MDQQRNAENSRLNDNDHTRERAQRQGTTTFTTHLSSKGDGARSRIRHDLGDIGRNRPYHDVGMLSTDPDVNEHELKALFETFIQTFRVEHHRPANPNDDWDDWELFDVPTSEIPHYLHQLQTLFENFTSSDSLNCKFPIDLLHIKAACPKLLRATIRHPADLIIFMDEVLSDTVERLYIGYGVTDEILRGKRLCPKTTLFHHPHVSCMRDLEPKHIETLVAIRGNVVRCSAIMPDMREACFRCTSRNHDDPTGSGCGHEERVLLAAGHVDEPLQCIKCQSKYSFELFHAQCIFGNKQIVKVQETSDSIPEGEVPQTVMAYVYDEMIDVCKPGDFIELTGIFRCSPIRINPRLRIMKSVYRGYIDGNSIHTDHLSRFLIPVEEMEGLAADANPDDFEESNIRNNESSAYLTAATRRRAEIHAKLMELGSDPHIYSKLAQSLAPNIFETEDVKKGLLCQLFGGVSKFVDDKATESKRNARSDIHILLCGDPSTAKSQLLKYVHGVTPRGVYVCGRGSSAVGLTASVARDPETKEFVLQSGAIMLSDMGVCCIDEFDKMDESCRIILHEVMEQQTISVAKAGIVCSLSARTAVLASANPINSRYDPRRTVVENINLPSSLMSRFDLIYLMVDYPNEKMDRELATHLVRLCSNLGERKAREGPPIDRKTFTSYISYARAPKIALAARDALIEAYKQLRGRAGSGKSPAATPRQLESLIRLSESLAKMELKEEIEIRHVNEAVRLMQVATYSALVDPITGRLDFDQLNAGISGDSRARAELLETILLECLSAFPHGLSKAELGEKMSEKLKSNNEYSIEAESREFNVLLKELQEFGKIARVHGGRIVSQTIN